MLLKLVPAHAHYLAADAAGRCLALCDKGARLVVGTRAARAAAAAPFDNGLRAHRGARRWQRQWIKRKLKQTHHLRQTARRVELAIVWAHGCVQRLLYRLIALEEVNEASLVQMAAEIQRMEVVPEAAVEALVRATGSVAHLKPSARELEDVNDHCNKIASVHRENQKRSRKLEPGRQLLHTSSVRVHN